MIQRCRTASTSSTVHNDQIDMSGNDEYIPSGGANTDENSSDREVLQLRVKEENDWMLINGHGSEISE